MTQVTRWEHEQYSVERAKLRVALSGHVVRADAIYDFAELLITGGTYTITRTRGIRRNQAGVRLAYTLLAKALKTSRAIRVTTLEGCGQDAAVLLRSLFETTLAVLWILQTDTTRRTYLFGAHEAVRRRIKCQGQAQTPGLKRVGKKRLRVAERIVAGWIERIGEPAVASVRKHWCGNSEGLPYVARRIGWERPYHTIYRDTSAHAHGADPQVHVNVSNPSSLGTFLILPGPAECDRVLDTASFLLFEICRRLNERFGLGHDEELRRLHDILKAPNKG